MNNSKKIQTWANLLGRLPGVAAVFLSGSLAQGRGNESSDIDFFIITHPGQIWTARFFVFITLKLAGKLAKPDHHAGKICPNHFITTDQLEIQEKDAYSAHLFSHNKPVYDPNHIFPSFVEHNAWVADFGESFPTVSVKADYISPWAKNIWSLWRLLEITLKHFQIWIIKQNPESKIPGAKIVLTDTELRFHPIPKNQTWQK